MSKKKKNSKPPQKYSGGHTSYLHSNVCFYRPMLLHESCQKIKSTSFPQEHQTYLSMSFPK